MLNIKKAERCQKKAKLCLIGPSGSGKTYTALKLAAGISEGKERILVLDSERSSATLYAHLANFDHADLPDYSAETYLGAMQEAAKAGYGILIIDSISHAWEKMLERHEQEAIKAAVSRRGRVDKFNAWSLITPIYNRLINAVVTYPGHTIITMRAKTEWVVEQENGHSTPKRVGLGAVMRPGSEYEFDVVAMLDMNHNFVVEKTRYDFLGDQVIAKAGEELGGTIREWLLQGKEPPKPPPSVAKTPSTTSQPAKASPKKTPSTLSAEALAKRFADTDAAIDNGHAFEYDHARVLNLLGNTTDQARAAYWKEIRQKYGAKLIKSTIYCAVPIPEWREAQQNDPTEPPLDDDGFAAPTCSENTPTSGEEASCQE